MVKYGSFAFVTARVGSGAVQDSTKIIGGKKMIIFFGNKLQM
jgi:hypothetical protein